MIDPTSREVPLMLVPVRKRRRRRSQPPTPVPQGRRERRGATAMEYVVLASFIFIVVFAGIQNLGWMLGNSLTNSAQKVPSGK